MRYILQTPPPPQDDHHVSVWSVSYLKYMSPSSHEVLTCRANSHKHARSLRRPGQVVRDQAGNVQPVHQKGNHPPEPIEQQAGDNHGHGRADGLTGRQLGREGAQHQEGVRRQDPGRHGTRHAQLLLVKDDVVLKDDHEQRAARVEPEADLERPQEPRRAREAAEPGDPVDFGIVEQEINRHPVRAKVEALVRVVQAAQQRRRPQGEAARDERRKGGEEDEGQHKEALANGEQARERVGLLREEHGQGARRHGGLEPGPGEVREALAERHLLHEDGGAAVAALERRQVALAVLERRGVVAVGAGGAGTPLRHQGGPGWTLRYQCLWSARRLLYTYCGTLHHVQQLGTCPLTRLSLQGLHFGFGSRARCRRGGAGGHDDGFPARVETAYSDCFIWYFDAPNWVSFFSLLFPLSSSCHFL